MARERLRIDLGGGYSPDEFLEAMDRIVQSFVTNGMDEIRGAALYMEPFQANRRLHFYDQGTGVPFKLLRYDGPHERAYRPITHRLRPYPAES